MEEKIRINKYLSECGVLSRRKADEAIEKGLITVNGRPAEKGDRVSDEDEVLFNGSPVKSRESIERVILAYNKPLGLVCTAKDADKDSLFRKIDYPDMLY